MSAPSTEVDGNKRPISVVVLACLYIGVGAAGFIFHFRDSVASPQSGVWIELTEALAVIAGAFMLRRQNWARWLAVAWIAFHVVLSAFGRLTGVAIHTVFLAVIAWLLFRPGAARYFRRQSIQTIP